ncbi:nitronate monooxygenase [Verrucomicrobiaceae bacterium N1E253]|uniref:Nitronate monooxygenase n=1 Tax=Oceaniferula marina TaxID=2748318 RepID=A0A851GPA2_9BACT|nr:nitronate monooxygenase [Oceaniferula marina]NWK56660.1 nitronate monooxygenase [Oceaniferula marina]
MIFPQIIQGGMGISVSSWQLANAVATRGQIGVVSGTAIDLVLVRSLQNGDPGGHRRRAMAAFPRQEVVERILEKYFIADGKEPEKAYSNKTMVGEAPSIELQELLIVANFVEVYLAKEGHNGLVGINFLHKIQTPMMPSIYGAMLAGVDVIIVGAGIPLEIPKIIDGLSRNEAVEFSLPVKGATDGAPFKMQFDPNLVFDDCPEPHTPYFFPIVSSVTLANLMVKKCGEGVNGLIIEGPTAGGHNAPPRGKTQYNERGEPVYGKRDEVDFEKIRDIGLPFFIAGSFASHEKLEEAKAMGATGIQVGSLFAFSDESGLTAEIKLDAVRHCLAGTESIFRDPVASPTGFPFQVLSLPDTLSEQDVYEDRKRICDLGYLREAYQKEDGSLGWRCASEPLPAFLRKGGTEEDAKGRKCLCNSLMANIGMPQRRKGGVEELPLLTSGYNLTAIKEIVKPGKETYSASEVVDFLLGE